MTYYMKKLLVLLFSLLFFSTSSVFAEIPRNSINKIKQLNWSEIIDAVSETYQYATMVSNNVNQDGSNFYYPADEKYGKLSNNGIGKYKYKEPKFGGFIEFISDAAGWSIDKQNNKICYGDEADDLIDEYTCVYLFEGFENDKKYLYYSETKNGNFYSRIDHIEKINNKLIFNQWSNVEKIFSKENILNVKIYNAVNFGEPVPSDLKQQRADLKQQRINIALEEKRIEDLKAKSRLSAKNNPGFRELRPGLHYEDVLKICPLEKDFFGIDSYWVRCYGINNIKFKAHYTDDLLDKLFLDMGPIVEEGFDLDIFGEDDSNIYTKMKKSLGNKYTLEYEYSERDRQLFNESEKSSLFHVYSNGQVALNIARMKKDYSNALWLFVEYRDSSQGEWFLDENKPILASEDDF